MPSAYLLAGDMRETLRALPDDSIDSCVVDPPYHLASIVKRFGKEGSAPAQFGTDGAFARASKGFNGKTWDGGDISYQPETWFEVLRVLKPGGHMLCFGGTKSFHRIAVAVEDSGFELRDTLMWLYGTGFPKSRDISKDIDRTLGATRTKIRHAARPESSGTFAVTADTRPWIQKSREVGYHEVDSDEPVTDEAIQWHGWGTGLKPAFEPIVMARKSFKGSVAANVLKFGTGAININGSKAGESFPANVLHDGSDEVVEAFPSGKARFFYSGKANKEDRDGSEHPTVKPQNLMRYLVKLVTPVGGTVLDCFAGSGSTGVAALAEGFNTILCEREAEYIADISRRIPEIKLLKVRESLKAA